MSDIIKNNKFIVMAKDGDHEYVAQIEVNNPFVLTQAIHIDNLDIIKYMCNNFGDKINYYYNICEIACEYGRLHMVEYVCDNYGTHLSSLNYSKLLKLACLGGYVDIVKYLCQNKNITVDLDDLNYDISRYIRDLDILKCLYDNYGAHISPVHYRNQLQYACRRGFIDIVKYLSENKNITIDLNDGISECMNHLDILEYLLSNGADINHDGNIALKIAAHKNNLDLVRYLLRHGAQIDYDTSRSMYFAKVDGIFSLLRDIKSIWGIIETKCSPEIQIELHNFNNRMVQIKSARKI